MTIWLDFLPRYVPYPGGGEKWGGNGVGDDLFSFGFDGANLWTGGRSSMVLPSHSQVTLKLNLNKEMIQWIDMFIFISSALHQEGGQHRGGPRPHRAHHDLLLQRGQGPRLLQELQP